MSRERALYFPHIKVPSGSWFVRSLLYWDKVLTITPSRRDGDGLDDAFTHEAVAEGLVDQLYPAGLVYRISDFGSPFLDQIDRRLRTVKPGRLNEYDLEPTWIHLEKLGTVAHGLDDRHLVLRFDGPWASMPRWVANQFMTYLAISLGRLAQAKATPITNDPSCWGCLFQPFSLTRTRPEHDMSLPRIELLEVLFPEPEQPPPLAEIAKFKQRHKTKLAKLRNRIEAEAAVIASGATPEARSALRISANERIESDIKAVEDAMKSKWKVVLRGAAAALPVGWALGQAVVKDPISVAAGMSTLSTALFVQQNIAKASEVDQLESSPLAYAAEFRRRFSVAKAGKR